MTRFSLALALLLALTHLANAEPDDMIVSSWSADCEHTMTTNHFDLGPGQSVQIELDLSGCRADRLGSFLYFGYITTRKSSRPLTRRDRVNLTLTNMSTRENSDSDDGSMLTDVRSPTTLTLRAENAGRKTVRLRLRSSSGV